MKLCCFPFRSNTVSRASFSCAFSRCQQLPPDRVFSHTRSARSVSVRLLATNSSSSSTAPPSPPRSNLRAEELKRRVNAGIPIEQVDPEEDIEQALNRDIREMERGARDVNLQGNIEMVMKRKGLVNRSREREKKIVLVFSLTLISYHLIYLS